MQAKSIEQIITEYKEAYAGILPPEAIEEGANWYRERMQSLLLEAERRMPEKMIQEGRAHGTCCVCPTCHYDYDDCQCEYNMGVADCLRMLRNMRGV